MADSPSQAQSGLDVLAAADLAKTNTSSSKLPAITNQNVLDDMQKLYEQKLAEKNYFMQDLADAQAWWSGGAAGPSSGLALRAQTRAQQAKDLQDLQMALSQGKVNIAQLGEANTSMGQPSANVSGLPAGGAPSAATPTGGYTIRGVPVPEGVFKAYQAYIKGGNLAKANEVFEKYSQEAAKGEINFSTNPAAYKQDEYYDDRTGKITGKNPMQIRGATTTPTSIPVARSALTANAAEVTPTAPVKPTGGEDVYRFENLSDGAKERLNNYARTELGLKSDVVNRIDASELFNKMPIEQRKNAFLKSGETPVASQPTSTTPTATAPTTGGAVPDYSQAKAISAGQKSFEEKAQTKAGEAAGTRQGVFEEAAVDASKDLQNANVMLNIIDKHPESVGLSYKNKALGTTIEGIKFLTGKDIEPLARRASLSPDAIEAGNKFDALAETNNLKFRKAVMKGTGQVSDFETKLTERASGLSKDNSVEANRFFATIAAENYRTLNKLGIEWQKYQKANPGAVFSQFEQSEVWKSAQAERENRLKTYFPEIERSDLAFGSKAPTKGAHPTEVEGWRKRYGTKKED
jgi:hypothetical protein